MKSEHLMKQTIEHHKELKRKAGEDPHLQWWQLSLIGIGSVIGAGFFLGTGLSIQIAGPAILINYLLGGLTAFFVFSALAEMTVNDPQPGSFRTYAFKAFGHAIGFLSGWMYWLSGILIMSSEVVALSTFTRFWFPHTPLWIFSILYSIVAFGINLLGVSNFGKIESSFAAVKLTMLIAFIVLGVLVLFHVVMPGGNAAYAGTAGLKDFAPNGVKGMWAALIFVFFSFGGIEIMGIAANELKNKKDVPKAGMSMLFLLVLVYVLSLFFVLMLVSWTRISSTQSPFVTALSSFKIPFLDSLFNLIIISAAFSTMVGALFSITSIMVSLAHDGDAPKAMALKNSRGVAVKSLLLSGVGLAVSIVLSYLLPNTVYEYVTTAAGVMLILNWVIILSSQIKLHPGYNQTNRFFRLVYPYASSFGILMILLTVSGALMRQNLRIGVYISLGLILIIFLSYWMRSRRSSE